MATPSASHKKSPDDLFLGFRRFSEIQGTVDLDLDCLLELRSDGACRVESIRPQGINLTALVEAALGQIERLALNDEDLAGRWRRLCASPHNKSALIVSVAEHLDCDAVRYYPGSPGEPNFIFRRKFVEKEWDAESDAFGFAVAIRLFHLLGQEPFVSQYKLLRTEYELLKADLLLYRAAARDGRLAGKLICAYAPEHLAVVEWFNSEAGSGFRKTLDLLLDELEKLENELNSLYRNHGDTHMYDVRVLEARRDRIERAFQSADPDNSKSVLSKLKQCFLNGPGARNSFLSLFLEVLGQRGVAAGRESFFFLNHEPFGRIPFRHLKNPRIPCPWLADWKRQYFGFSKKRRFSDGLGVTFAEDKPGYVQKMHSHPSVERTAYLSDNKAVYFSKDQSVIERVSTILTSQGQEAARSYILEQGEWNANTNTGMYIRPKFGDVTVMPADYMHSLFTIDDKRRSVDFTLKDPVTQIIKDFSPKDESQIKVSHPTINIGDDHQPSYDREGVTIIRRRYGRYNTRLAVNPETGEMLIGFDENGRPVPVMYEPATLYNNIVVLQHGAVTPPDLAIFQFEPMYPEDKAQFIHILPYPRWLPEEWFLDFDDVEQELAAHKDNPELARAHIREILMLKDRGWIDHSFLRAEVTVFGHDWQESKLFEGGDTIILDNSIDPAKSIIRFAVRNVSLRNLSLVLLILELRDRPTAEQPHMPHPADGVLLPCGS